MGNNFDSADDEIRAYVVGADNKVRGAFEIASIPGCSSYAADLAYNGVADAVNLLTKAVIRKRGRVIADGERAPSLLREATTLLSRGGKPLPSVVDLTTIVLNRNGSVHDGAASASEIESVTSAVAITRIYRTACAAYIGVS
jgi:hypothetical protein